MEHRQGVATICALVALLAQWQAVSAAPEIAFVTEPACHNEVIVVTGEGLDPSRTKVKASYLGSADGAFDPGALDDPRQFVQHAGRMPSVPDAPPAQALDCPVLGGGERFLHVLMQCARKPWVFVPATTALWVGDERGWSRPYVVNRPQAHWLSPRTQAPGEVIRVFGRTFAWGHQLPPSQAFLRKVGGAELVPLRRAAQHREDGHTERWCLSAWLPKDVAPGEYEVFVHGRHGGPYGWSDALSLRVAPEPEWTGAVVNVRELGAKGDGLSDDTDALEQALQRAAGGGIVFLPAGAYAVSRKLEIPEQVLVRGVEMRQSVLCNLERPTRTPGLATDAARPIGTTALVHGMGRFTLQDLTIRFMPATGAALEIGKDLQYVEDVTLYRVRLETRQDYGLSLTHDYTAKPLSIYNCRRFRMIRCETYGPGGVGCGRKLEDSQFSQNVFSTDRRWRGSAFKFWGAEHCIFEDNVMRGDTRGFIMQTHFGVNYRNFIAGNLVERAVLGGNAGETYMVEGAGYLYESPVSRADAQSLATTRWPQVRGRPATAEDCLGRFVVVARGKGFGQWRRITRADPERRTLGVDRPWRVVPDASSTVVVMNGLIETVFVNNQEVDSGKGLYLYYAGAINNVIDRHLCDRSLGITLMTRDDRQEDDAAAHDTAPDFFNLIRNCRVHDGGGMVIGAGGRLPLRDDPHAPMASFGNRVIGNEVLRTKPFSGAQYGYTWRYGGGYSHLMAALSVIPMDLGKEPGTGLDGPPRMVGNVLQDNWVGDTRFGFGISQRAAHTLLYKNYQQWVPNRILDKGIATQEVEPVERGDLDYTPERGPIR
ncbi:MAG: hypothetical protein FJ279_03065 [Planctomycetes bacterium]|nr:hypothetical protein [Planctomycetota bacterium]